MDLSRGIHCVYLIPELLNLISEPRFPNLKCIQHNKCTTNLQQ